MTASSTRRSRSVSSSGMAVTLASGTTGDGLHGRDQGVQPQPTLGCESDLVLFLGRPPFVRPQRSLFWRYQLRINTSVCAQSQVSALQEYLIFIEGFRTLDWVISRAERFAPPLV